MICLSAMNTEYTIALVHTKRLLCKHGVKFRFMVRVYTGSYESLSTIHHLKVSSYECQSA